MQVPSWRIFSDRVDARLTRRGGQLAPVTFVTANGPIQPFAIAPWAGERLNPETPPLLRSLRGDFFCLPFGGNGTAWQGERHPPHGETAAWPWSLRENCRTSEGAELTAEMKTSVRPGHVRKIIRLRNGETNVYCRHELLGFSGPMSVGHHAMLAFPAEEGSGAISLSPWQEGRVLPDEFELPANGGYSALKAGARFRDLRRVPLARGGWADLSLFPARAGFDDLVMVSARPAAKLAWTAVAFPRQGYLWFGLKDPTTLASTVLWHSHGGRHYAPWNGRHRNVLGLEEATSYFHYGLAESVKAHPLGRRKIPTVLKLRPDRPTRINYVMGVVAIPRGFDRVRTVSWAGGKMIFHSDSGATVSHSVDRAFFEPSVSLTRQSS